MSRDKYEDEFEEEFEDELDRMRSRRRNRRARERSKESPSDHRQMFYHVGNEADYDASEDYDPSDYELFDGDYNRGDAAFDDDFQVEYLEDGPDLMTIPAKGQSKKFSNDGNGASNRASQSNSLGQANRPKNGPSQSPVGRKRPCSDYPQNSQRNTSSSGSGKNKRPKKPKKKRRIWKLLLLFLLLFSAYLYGKRWMKDRDGYWNIAVFGVDSRDNNLGKGALADVQMIASINKKTGEIRLVSVFRDTYVQINDDGEFHKINEAYFKGGYPQALDTLKRNLDIQVDDYATFNWKAVADAINILGGIDLEITDSEFKYINSFITETVESTGVYSTHLQNAGWNHLDGVQAVAYSRLRLMDTDFNRTERQRKVVSLALDKAKQADLTTLKTVIGTVLPEISTSIGIEDVIPMARSVNRYHLGQTGGFPFAKTTAMVGKMDCVIPMTLESNVILLHQFLFDVESYEPSLSVKRISGEISQRTGIYEEGKASGIDTNLTPPPQNPGGGEGGQGGGNSGNAAENPAPVIDNPSPETPPETPAEEGSMEEASSEETEAELSSEAATPEQPIEPPIAPPEEPIETTISEDQRFEGPGATAPDNPTEAFTKPDEPTAESYGPGFE